MCKAISVKSGVPKSAVDGAKKCGRGLEKKPYPKKPIFFKKLKNKLLLKSF
jgi:hypothetical protein